MVHIYSTEGCLNGRVFFSGYICVCEPKFCMNHFQHILRIPNVWENSISIFVAYLARSKCWTMFWISRRPHSKERMGWGYSTTSNRMLAINVFQRPRENGGYPLISDPNSSVGHLGHTKSHCHKWLKNWNWLENRMDTPLKTNMTMTMEYPQFQVVFPIENGDFQWT